MDGFRETLTALEQATVLARRGIAAAPAVSPSTLAACAQCAAFSLPFQGFVPTCAVPAGAFPTGACPLPAGFGMPVFGAYGAVPPLAFPGGAP